MAGIAAAAAAGLSYIGGGSAIAGAATLAGTAFSIASTLKSAEAAKEAERFNQQTARDNARKLQIKAAADQVELRKELYRAKGAQAAAAGASGISGGSGSPLDILAESVAQGTLDAQRIKFGADSASKSYSDTADILGRQINATDSNATLTSASQLLSGLMKYR
jgi:hypothetical protein